MKSKLRIILFLGYILLSAQAYGQSTEQEYNIQYEINIKQEYINDVYIPSDIEDAFKQLDKLSTEEGRKKMLEANEEIAADRLVFGLGKWMILNWHFYEGSRLSHYVKGYGVTLPDDMAKFLIVSYHRYLRNVPLDLKERGQTMFAKRKAEQEIRNQKRNSNY